MVDVAYGGDFRPTTSHTAAATLNKSLGAHLLQGGVEMRIYREDSLSTANATSGPVHVHATRRRARTAPAAADFNGPAGLRRVPPRHAQHDVDPARLPTTTEYSKTWGFFVQDDWRVNDKLTLNLGLRYEVETPLTERNNHSVSGFDIGYVQPIEGGRPGELRGAQPTPR